MRSDTAILVAAGGPYSDTWDAFFSLFFKYWPDCPYPVYLFSEEGTSSHPKVIPLVIGENPKRPWREQWEPRMRKALSQIGADCFMYLHTDYFLSGKVDTARIKRLRSLFLQDNVGCIRLIPAVPTKLPYPGDENLGIILKSDRYPVSLQAALWRTKTFESLLAPGSDPWSFEIEGSRDSYKLIEQFLSVKKGSPAIPYVHGIVRGIWQYDAVRHLKREGLWAGTSRETEGLAAYLCRKLYVKSLGYRVRLMFGLAKR